jgi:hypothetical protein
MGPRHINCPSCGAGHDITNPGIVTIVCEYCGNAIYWDAKKVQSAGEQSILPEGFSRLYRGATGRLKGRRFFVMGRVRYSFGSGFWDEWFLEFGDGGIAWLTEDNHEFAVEKRAAAKNLPPMDQLSPGTRLTVKGIPFVIEEVGKAECLGMEGDLPISVESGETYAFADGSSPDGKYSLGLEFDHDPAMLYLGQWLRYEDIQMDDEGIDW